MKLYTEEQVKESFKSGFRLAMETDGGLKEGKEEFINSLTPIQLPSDEEIEVERKRYGVHGVLFSDGAKWMKEQILNQNKELLILDFDKVKEEWIREANGMTDLEKANYYHQKIQKNENR